MYFICRSNLKRRIKHNEIRRHKPLSASAISKQERAYSGIQSRLFGSRNEEANNSTRNMIYSLKVFCFLLYRRRYFLFLKRFSTRVSDDQKYLCSRRLYACINIRKFRGLNSTEKLHHCQKSKKWFTRHIISIIAENKSHAHHNTVKVYNTRPSQFC